MQGFVQGADRQQTTLLPECLDDWVGESNPIRAVDVFVDALELRDLGFDGVDPAATGRPAYHPSPMLKLYIYGYLNRVQSSRRLEREAGRNLEVMWLTGRLAPDHKTIADFRKDNGPAIRKVCAQFVELCRKMGLLTKASVAIDGSKFKAVNSRDNNFTQGKIQRRQKQIEESVARYMSQLDTADRQTAAGEEPSETVLLTKTRLKEKLAKLEEEVKRLAAIEKALLASPDKQISLTDPDCAEHRRRQAIAGSHAGVRRGQWTQWRHRRPPTLHGGARRLTRDAEQQKYSEIAALVSVTVGREQFRNAEPRFYTAWVQGRTSAARQAMSEKCHKRTPAARKYGTGCTDSLVLFALV